MKENGQLLLSSNVITKDILELQSLIIYQTLMPIENLKMQWE